VSWGSVALYGAIAALGGPVAVAGGIAAGVAAYGIGIKAGGVVWYKGANALIDTLKSGNRGDALRRKIGPAIDQASGRHGSAVAVQRALQANIDSEHCDWASVSTMTAEEQPPVPAPTLAAAVAGHTWWDVLVDGDGACCCCHVNVEHHTANSDNCKDPFAGKS
jgi:hypothetical protein